MVMRGILLESVLVGDMDVSVALMAEEATGT